MFKADAAICNARRLVQSVICKGQGDSCVLSETFNISEAEDSEYFRVLLCKADSLFCETSSKAGFGSIACSPQACTVCLPSLITCGRAKPADCHRLLIREATQHQHHCDPVAKCRSRQFSSLPGSYSWFDRPARWITYSCHSEAWNFLGILIPWPTTRNIHRSPSVSCPAMALPRDAAHQAPDVVLSEAAVGSLRCPTKPRTIWRVKMVNHVKAWIWVTGSTNPLARGNLLYLHSLSLIYQ